MKRQVIVSATLLCSALVAASAGAVLPDRLQNKVADTARVLEEFMVARDSEVPTDLMESAECIAVLPDVTKGALVVGGRYGKGLVSCRKEDRSWGPPLFLEISGASIGFQIGGEVVDLLLVVRNRKGADYLLRNKFTLGADASAAAGPVGRTVGAATDAALQAGILYWSRTRGAFAGVALDGAVVKQDKSDNRLLYGRKVLARDVLLPKGVALTVPPEAQPFLDALARHAK